MDSALVSAQIDALPFEKEDFLTGISTVDYTLHGVVQDLQAMLRTGELPQAGRNPRHPSLRLRISKTQNCGENGAHWFVLAYTIEPLDADAEMSGRTVQL